MAQALTVVSMRVAVLGPQLVPVRELVQRLMQEPELELALGLQLEREPPVMLAWELVLVQALARVLELARAAAPESRQARELRVSRQQEQQQHHLQAAAQELPPYLPALPMKALC